MIEWFSDHRWQVFLTAAVAWGLVEVALLLWGRFPQLKERLVARRKGKSACIIEKALNSCLKRCDLEDREMSLHIHNTWDYWVNNKPEG